MKLPLPPTAFELEVLKFARETVIDDNGKPVSNLNLVFRTMKAMMMQKPELGKILLDRIDAAAKAEEEHKLSMLQDAIAFKADMGPRFAKARALGKPLPPVYPDPDDIIIRDDGSVTFIGPVNADEARQLKVLLDHRDLLFKSAQDTVADAGDKYSVELAREYWGIFRREYYKFSKFIPKRYRKTFPPFKPREENEGAEEEG